MTFDSIDEAIAYIKSAVADCMNPIGDDIQLIMEKAIETDIYGDHNPQVYDRTGQLLETPTTTHTDGTSVEVEYMENGSWPSFSGKKSYFPILAYKNGTVVAPGGGYYSADPTTTAFNECQEKIPEELADLLRAAGIPIE